MILSHKRAWITGASLGLGRAIAETFIKEGADVFLCARTEKTLNQTVLDLNSRKVRPDQKILGATCNVADKPDVFFLSERITQELGGLDILVNNAGIYGPKGASEEVAWDEWRQALEINLYGVMLPSRSVIRTMKQQKRGKIINLSGGGATAPLPFLSAYAASKAAVVRLTETLAEELREYHIDINAVAPGALNTRLLDEILAAGPEKVGANFYERSLKQRESGGSSLELAAALCAYLASEKSDGITGKLLSAPWDPWPNLEEHLPEIAKSDIYTLRRIVPKDRGLSWGDK